MSAPAQSPMQVLSSSLIAGALAGLVTLTYSVSYAALIFAGPLAKRLDVGMGIALMSAVLVAAVVAMRSSFRFTIAGPDSNASAILAIMAAGIVSSGLSEEAALGTVIVTLAASSVAVGICLWAIGLLKQGYLVRFIPYPVLGGFLAGTGWLITLGSFSVMTGRSVNLSNPGPFLEVLTQWQWLRLWGPGFLLAMVMMQVLKRFSHYMVLPSLIVGGVVISHLALLALGISNEEAREVGWLYGSFAKEPSVFIWSEVNFDMVAWSEVFAQSGNLLAMTGVVVITILLNSTGIELFAEQDADLNRELSAAGSANILSGLFGGLIGYQSISRSLLNYKAGGRSRAAGVVAALFCTMFFLGASPALTAIPKLVLGGLLMYLGLGLLREWVIQAWVKLSRVDYALVISILLVIALFGFLEGVGFGLGISMILFVVSYSRIKVVKHSVTVESHRSSYARPIPQQEILTSEGKSTLILNLQGYLFFGTANSLLDQVKASIEEGQGKNPLKNVILDFRLVSGLDSSVTLSFQKILQTATTMGVQVYLTDLDPAMKDYFAGAKLLDETGKKGYRSFSTLDYCVQYCEDHYIRDAGMEISPQNPNIAQELEEMFLEKEQVNRFITYLEEMHMAKGQHLCYQGDEADSMYFVSVGQVTAQLEIPNGPTIRLISLGPGTVFGEMGLYTTSNRSAAVVTDEDSVLYELKARELERMQKEDPDMATALHRFIIRLLSDRVSQTNRKVQHLN